MMSNTSTTLSPIKNGCNGNSMSHLCAPIINSYTQQVIRGKRELVQTTMAFIGEQDYDRLDTDDGIIDIKGQHATK